MGDGRVPRQARLRSVRAFSADPVDPGSIERLLAAGLRTPSAGNSRGVHLLVLVGAAETARHWDVSLPVGDRRDRFGHPGLLRAPVLIEVLTDPGAYVSRYAEPDKAGTGLGAGTEAWPVPYWFVDGGMAAMAILRGVEAEGMGACFFGLFEHEQAVLGALGVPEGIRSVGTIALGHPDPAYERPGRSAGRPRVTATAIHRRRW